MSHTRRGVFGLDWVDCPRLPEVPMPHGSRPDGRALAALWSHQLDIGWQFSFRLARMHRKFCEPMSNCPGPNSGQPGSLVTRNGFEPCHVRQPGVIPAVARPTFVGTGVAADPERDGPPDRVPYDLPANPEPVARGVAKANLLQRQGTQITSQVSLAPRRPVLLLSGYSSMRLFTTE